MKLTLLIILLSFSEITLGNMACPWIPGTNSSTVLTSKDIDITQEKLFIKINKHFSDAEFRIQYYINTNESGIQIPLLFCAEKYKSDFRVWIDGKKVEIKQIEEFVKQTKDTKFHKFRHYFNKSDYDKSESISVFWSEHVGDVYNLSDLKYFEVNLSKGAHCIEVTYTADHYTDIGDEDFFIYSLSPAEHWKSFNKLFVEVNNTAFGKEINTNLGKPLSGKLDSIATWEFNQLPNKFIEVTHAIKEKGNQPIARTKNASTSSLYLIIAASLLICFILLFLVFKPLRG